MKRMLRNICIFILVIIPLGYGVLYILYPYAIISERRHINDSVLENFVVATLKIPYVANLRSPYMQVIEILGIKKNLEDLEEITHEEWMNMQCDCPKPRFGYKPIGVFIEGGFYAENKLDIPTQKYIQCIGPGREHYPESGYHKKIVASYGGGFFEFSSIKIYANEYVLKYPKVLNNLIKIMEKPCFYIDDLEASKAEDKKTGRFPDNTMRIETYRDALYCYATKYMLWEQDKIFSEIIVVDSKGRLKMQIVIPRTDNVHLVKEIKY